MDRVGRSTVDKTMTGEIEVISELTTAAVMVTATDMATPAPTAMLSNVQVGTSLAECRTAMIVAASEIELTSARGRSPLRDHARSPIEGPAVCV